MDALWERLPQAVRQQVDAELDAHRLLQAIMVLCGQCGLNPAPGLHEAVETVILRRQRLIDGGRLEPEPPPAPMDVEEIIATARAIGASVAAIEADWDGDSFGWMVDLYAIVERPSRHHARFDEVRLAIIRHGDDLRVFNGQVPPWPEVAQARRIGEAVAARLGVPFHFTDPDASDIGLPRWWDTQPAAPDQYT